MAKKTKIQTLDEAFSKFIRLQGADNGFSTCFTCGKRMHWKQLQCGHYISRRHNSLRFDPKNCKPQCTECNCFKNGNLEAYKQNLIRHFGIAHIWYLEEKKNDEKQWSDAELDILIGYYRAAVKKMEKNL